MTITIDCETCTIIVEIRRFSYAVLVSKLTGKAYSLTVEELIRGLEMAAKPK